MENPETGLPEEGGASRVTSPQPSTVTGTRESHGGCMNRAHTRPPDLARFHQPLCCLMASESFGCHDISRHRSGVGLPDGRAAASVCRSGVPRSLWWLTASSGCTARGWGTTGRELGVLGVGGAFVQYAQPLASRSRPSWSRPTRADSRRDRSQIMTTRTLPRWRVGTTPRPTVKPFEPGPCADGGQGAVGRTCDKGALLCGKNPGLTPARHGVHSTDINGPDVNVPSGDRWNPAVVLRCTAQMRL